MAVAHVCAECGNTGLRKVEKGPAGATYTVLRRCACQTPTITIPRTQYEALMSAAKAIVKHCERVPGYAGYIESERELGVALGALRAAGIGTESK